jgi:ribosomal protein S18 acetylase RimI-like enzyme
VVACECMRATNEPHARAATVRDYPLFVRAFAELGVDDAVPSHERWTQNQLATSIIFEEAGQFVAYAYYNVLAETGYIRQLVVVPQARGRGIGHAVMRELRGRFRNAGCSLWCLNVKPTNAPALRVYEAAGMRAEYRATALRMSWSTVSSLPVPDCEWSAEPAAPTEDAELESRFALDCGLITARRARLDQQIVVLRSRARGVVLGFACFDPTLPGASPFAAESLGAVRALLESWSPSTTSEALVTIVVRDNADLTEALLSAGAMVRLEVVHYRGKI